MKRYMLAGLAAGAALLVGGTASPAQAERQARLDIVGGIASKDLDWRWNTQQLDGPQGFVRTWFKFHPNDYDRTNFVKDPAAAVPGEPAVPIIDPIVHENDLEVHQSTGSSTYHLSLQHRRRANGVDSFDVRAKAVAKVNAGFNNTGNSPIRVKVNATDPWSFGSVEQGAALPRNDAGFDCSFSMSAGTAFPAPIEYPPDVEPESTLMEYVMRVAPGVVNDPDAFWGDHLSAVNLFRVSITADAAGSIAVDLAFGQSTDQFGLDFLDSAGNPFDPSDPVGVGLIRQQILGAFVEGEVLTDLSNAFTVGFVPLGGLDSYTIGKMMDVDVPDVEVPAPSIASMMLLGGVWASRRWR